MDIEHACAAMTGQAKEMLRRRDMLTNIAEGQDIPVTPDTGLDLAKNADPKQAITFVEYPDLDSRTWELMQLMMQVVQLRSGHDRPGQRDAAPPR
jgi:hypothetical protein